MIIPSNIHSSWTSFLTTAIIKEINNIESQLGNNYNPTNSSNVLRFLTTDLNKVKVIWLGQDAYPAKGVATGRSFEVGGLMNWNKPFRQVSLKNIVRLIYKGFSSTTTYDDIKSFKEILIEINSGKFPIKHPPDWFDSLENQGVLFLNTSFTCEINKPNSHKVLWASFSQKVITHISTVRPDIAWFLWGKEAIWNGSYIKKGIKFESRHPMLCSNQYRDDFLKSDCFMQTSNIINWLG